MSIQVTRNPDGSYTISCGAESVIVGGAGYVPIDTELPEESGGGVCAFVVIGTASGHQLPWLSSIGTMPFELSDNRVEAILGRLAENRLLDLTGRLKVSKPVDLASLVHDLDAEGYPASSPMILRIPMRRFLP